MSQENKEKILNKIQKLLALANSPNIHESSLAATKAKELMDKYQIEEIELDGELIEEVSAEESDIETTGRLTDWKCNLLYVLTKYNHCRFLIRKTKVGVGNVRTKYQKTFILVGTKTDKQLVSYLYKFCVRQIDYLQKIHASKQGRVFANNFRLGCVDAIEEAFKKEKEEFESWANQIGKGSALVLLNKKDQIAQKILEQKTVGTRTGSAHHGNQDARDLGQKVGQSINVTKSQNKISPPIKKLK